MVVIVLTVLAVLTLVRFLLGPRCEPLRDRFAQRRAARRALEAGPVPLHRPFELVAADVRRRGARYHQLDPRTPFVKADAVRSAYDHVLAECCDVLGIAHLLNVLAPGPQLDVERERVEGALERTGVWFPRAA